MATNPYQNWSRSHQRIQKEGDKGTYQQNSAIQKYCQSFTKNQSQSSYRGDDRYKTIDFYITKVFFPKRLKDYKGFIIAKMKYVELSPSSSTNNNDVIIHEETIKGNLPYASCYFEYKAVCCKEYDMKMKKSYFQIINIVKIEKRPHIDGSTLRWMICEELGEPDLYFMKKLRQLFPKTFESINDDHKIEENLIKTKCPDLWQSFYNNNVEFFLYDQRKILTTWFTHDGGGNDNKNVKNQGGGGEKNRSHKNLSSIMKIPAKTIKRLREEMETEDWWLFAFKRHCVEFDEELQCSVKSMKILKKYSYSRKILDNDPYELKLKAIECYRYFKKVRNITYNTNFFESLMPEKYRKHGESIFNLLINDAKMIVKEDINTQPVYSLIKDYTNHHAIYKGIKRVAKNFYENRNQSFTIRKGYKGPSKKLTDKQQEVMDCIGKCPLINVVGLPGRGKTQIIKELRDKYENLMTLSFVGSMVASLKERGIREAMTIHSSIFEKLKAAEELKSSGNPMSLLKFLLVEIVIVDEFTNVDNKLAAEFYSIFPNIRCVIHAFDPMQIGPIDPGNLALELERALPPEWTIKLTKQLRVVNNESKHIIDNDEFLLKKQFSNFIYTPITLTPTIKKSNSITPPTSSPSPSSCWYLITPSDLIVKNKQQKQNLTISSSTANMSPYQQQQQQQQLLISQQLKFYTSKLEYDLKQLLFTNNSNCPINKLNINVNNCKIITLTNSLKNRVNKMVESQKNPNSNKYLFYKGQKITITGRNFKSKRLTYKQTYDPNEKWDKVEEYAKFIHRKKNKNYGNEKRLIALGVYSDNVQNGEIYTFDYARDYDIVMKRWMMTSDLNVVLKSQPLPSLFKRYRRFIFTKCGKHFCIHPKYVPLIYIEPGWAITVNKSQGQEYKHCLFILPPSHYAVSGPKWTKKSCFNMHHMHVAITRAKENMLVYGTMETFKHIATNPVLVRYSILRWKISTYFKNNAHITATTTDAIIKVKIEPIPSSSCSIDMIKVKTETMVLEQQQQQHDENNTQPINVKQLEQKLLRLLKISPPSISSSSSPICDVNNGESKAMIKKKLKKQLKNRKSILNTIVKMANMKQFNDISANNETVHLMFKIIAKMTQEDI